MGGWFVVVAFAAGVAALGRVLKRHEQDGAFDVDPGAASSPGLRRFFDYRGSGWSGDGARQRPPG